MEIKIQEQNFDRLAAAIQALIAEEVAKQNAEIWKRVRLLEMKLDQMKWQTELEKEPAR